MTTIFKLRGAYFDRSISNSDISSIRDAKKRSDVNSTWGCIEDWFCGTNKEAAKRVLYDLMHPEDKENDKSLAHDFFVLRQLVPLHYQRQFKSNLKDGAFEFEIEGADICRTVPCDKQMAEARTACRVISSDVIETGTVDNKKVKKTACQTQSIKLRAVDKRKILKEIDPKTPDDERDNIDWIDSLGVNEYQQRKLLELSSNKSIAPKNFYPGPDHDINKYNIDIEIERMRSGALLVRVAHSAAPSLIDENGNPKKYKPEYDLDYPILHGAFIIGKRQTACIEYDCAVQD
jgi:hypothetical protein